jgi:Cys-tRNA(Pro)/Cys-tRNA(Cys) deacylase
MSAFWIIGHISTMPIRNNVTRLLDARRVPYELFELPPAKNSAEESAGLLRIPPQFVYKTLVVLREAKGKKPLLVMTAAGRELSLKALASSLGEKKLKMASQREAEDLTGLQVGGISALALLNRGFDICLARQALDLTSIHISAGQRGATLGLSPADLMALTQARLVDTA